MKRILILLGIMILTKIMSFSENISNPTGKDSTVLVTASDLKYANLIFVEHKKLLTENSLLYSQIDNLVNLNLQLEQIDSLRIKQIEEYSILTNNLNKELKKKQNTLKYWQIGGITVGVSLLLLFLLK